LQDFIRDQNIKLYRRALAESSNDEQRRVLLALLQLLVTEETALARHRQHDKPEISPVI
jgi:hypothetical protein